MAPNTNFASLVAVAGCVLLGYNYYTGNIFCGVIGSLLLFGALWSLNGGKIWGIISFIISASIFCYINWDFILNLLFYSIIAFIVMSILILIFGNNRGGYYY
ncbi:TPA: hypothetical protein HA335_05350 [Methanocaldococcus jannaschii]|nr:hypothetical protein [Methanocaldococcus jannaschii]HII59976.1 hypothetical protein [Methanocaldococcus jannaschii]